MQSLPVSPDRVLTSQQTKDLTDVARLISALSSLLELSPSVRPPILQRFAAQTPEFLCQFLQHIYSLPEPFSRLLIDLDAKFLADGDRTSMGLLGAIRESVVDYCRAHTAAPIECLKSHSVDQANPTHRTELLKERLVHEMTLTSTALRAKEIGDQLKSIPQQSSVATTTATALSTPILNGVATAPTSFAFIPKKPRTVMPPVTPPTMTSPHQPSSSTSTITSSENVTATPPSTALLPRSRRGPPPKSSVVLSASIEGLFE